MGKKKATSTSRCTSYTPRAGKSGQEGDLHSIVMQSLIQFIAPSLCCATAISIKCVVILEFSKVLFKLSDVLCISYTKESPIYLYFLCNLAKFDLS